MGFCRMGGFVELVSLDMRFLADRAREQEGEGACERV